MRLATLLATLPRFGPWAACKNTPPDVFEHEQNHPYPNPQARSICDGCTVRPECLSWALENDEDGVWGGLSTYQRQQVKRITERKRCPSCTAINLVSIDNVQVCLACGVSWMRRIR